MKLLMMKLLIGDHVMRATMTFLLALGSLAGCAYQQTREVNATTPTVSYQAYGNDISQAVANEHYGAAVVSHLVDCRRDHVDRLLS